MGQPVKVRFLWEPPWKGEFPVLWSRSRIFSSFFVDIRFHDIKTRRKKTSAVQVGLFSFDINNYVHSQFYLHLFRSWGQNSGAGWGKMGGRGNSHYLGVAILATKSHSMVTQHQQNQLLFIASLVYYYHLSYSYAFIRYSLWQPFDLD